jgi:glycogen synthase
MSKPNSSKSILILSWELLPLYAGGLGVLVRDIVDELKAQGHKVDVLIPRVPANSNIPDAISFPQEYRTYFKNNSLIPGLDFAIDSTDTGQRKKTISWPRLFSNPSQQSTNKHFVLYPPSLPKHVRAYAQVCKEYYLKHHQKYDLILGMDWLSIPAFHLIDQIRKELQLDTKFFFHVNSTEWDRSPNPKTILPVYAAITKLESTVFKRADKVLAISNITKRQLLEHCDVPSKQLVVISNNLTFNPKTNGYKELNKGKNILFIGRIDSQKGLQFLLDTAEKVVAIDPQIRFIIAGDGGEMPNVIETIAERSLEKNCIIIGWVNTEQKKLLYKSGDLFVMTSPSEPFGLTPLESVISGVPVLSSKLCGFLDVLPSTPTYDYHDTNRFAELLLHYINDQEDRKKLLAKQQAEYAAHSWSDEIKKIIELI